MKKTIEYNIRKKDIVNRIKLLIEGKIKTSSMIFFLSEKYHGSVSDDGFVLYAKRTFNLKIQGTIVDAEKRIEVNFIYSNWIYLWYVWINGMSLLAIVFGAVFEEYSMLIAFCGFMLFSNLYSICIFKIMAYMHYLIIKRIIDQSFHLFE